MCCYKILLTSLASENIGPEVRLSSCTPVYHRWSILGACAIRKPAAKGMSPNTARARVTHTIYHLPPSASNYLALTFSIRHVLNCPTRRSRHAATQLSFFCCTAATRAWFGPPGSSPPRWRLRDMILDERGSLYFSLHSTGPPAAAANRLGIFVSCLGRCDW